MKLSIIIPYHNSDPWIGAMLDSLLDQDLPREDYEIMVVDDGSTEEPVTLHRYAEAHANIRVFRQENAGVAVARNTGLDKSSGEWVWFCDSDDYVQPRVLGRLLAIADAQQLDMLWFDAVYVRQGKLAREPRLDFSAVSPVQTGWDYVVNPPAKMGMAVWRYLFRRELLAEGPLRFHPLNYVEGRWFQMELMPRVQRAAHVAADIYFYVQHSSSLLHASKAKNYAHFADEMAKYVGAMAAKAADPAVPGQVQRLLRQRCDLESYRLLGNVSRYGTPALADSYFTKLKALGTWPVRISGGLKEDLMWISPMAGRIIGFTVTGLWWLLVTIPLIRNYRQLHYVEAEKGAVRRVFAQIGRTLKTIVTRDKKVMFFLIAFFLYIDGVGTIIDNCINIGTDLGLPTVGQVVFLLATQVVAWLGSLTFARM